MEPRESQLNTIDRRIRDRQGALASIESLRPERRRARWRASASLRYLQCAALLRKPTGAFELWPIGVVTIGPLAVGTLCSLLFGLLALPIRMTVLTVISAWLASAGAFASLLFVPTKGNLPRLLERAILRHDGRVSEDIRIQSRREELIRELDELREEREQLLSSVLYRREQLLTRNWKAMRGVEWEEFLADAFGALGAAVEMTATSGDQGVDLIVTLRGRRIAVQAKGYYNVVSNSAVQEAVAGRAHYRCDSCAVITNSRFTRSARDLAASNGCILVDEDATPSFVRGQVIL